MVHIKFQFQETLKEASPLYAMAILYHWGKIPFWNT